ncbi:MAG: ComF family protein [Steroidobacteraceae bacterium]
MLQYSNSLEDCQPRLLQRVYDGSRSLLHRLFPATCYLCLDPGQPPSLDLCRGCENDLPRNHPACAICAMPGAGAGVCDRCRSQDRAFDSAFAAYRYEFPLVELIHRLKYRGQLPLGRILGTVLARRLAEQGRPRVEALVPVPLHHSRQARRGYNQAREIAVFAGQLLQLPVLDRIVERVRETEEQAALPAVVRRLNVSGAFAVHAGPLPAAVAIVDDVLTTGATVEALAVELKRAGLRRVEVWAVARAAGASTV